MKTESIIPKLHPGHFCRFNDGEQSCDCYAEGFNDGANSKYKSFESYLQDLHAKQYAGLDDEMGEDFGEWLGELDPQELIDYAEKWMKSSNPTKQ